MDLILHFLNLFSSVGRVMHMVAEWRVGDFDEQDLCMTSWALSWRESLRDAWSLFEHVKRIGVSFSPLCFGALLMECEQGGLFQHEIAF